MKSKLFITLTIVIILIASSIPTFPYGYGAAGEDPLITMFKEIVVEVKKSEKDWNRIKEIIEESKQPIVNMDSFFKLNLSGKFDSSIKDRNIKGIINTAVNLIYLSMMEKFELVKQKEFKDYDFSKGRLALNDKYYREIFSANVKRYDKKNETSINDFILKDLQDIQGTIGKPGKFGMAGEPAKPEDYNRLYQNIKNNLKTVFPNFED